MRITRFTWSLWKLYECNAIRVCIDLSDEISRQKRIFVNKFDSIVWPNCWMVFSVLFAYYGQKWDFCRLLYTHEAFTNFIATYISPYSYTHNNNPTFVCVRYSVLISLTSFNFFFKLACIVPVDLLIKNGKVVFNARKNCLKIIKMQSQYNKRNVTHSDSPQIRCFFGVTFRLYWCHIARLHLAIIILLL